MYYCYHVSFAAQQKRCWNLALPYKNWVADNHVGSKSRSRGSRIGEAFAM